MIIGRQSEGPTIRGSVNPRVPNPNHNPAHFRLHLLCITTLCRIIGLSDYRYITKYIAM